MTSGWKSLIMHRGLGGNRARGCERTDSHRVERISTTKVFNADELLREIQTDLQPRANARDRDARQRKKQAMQSHKCERKSICSSDWLVTTLNCVFGLGERRARCTGNRKVCQSVFSPFLPVFCGMTWILVEMSVSIRPSQKSRFAISCRNASVPQRRQSRRQLSADERYVVLRDAWSSVIHRATGTPHRLSV